MSCTRGEGGGQPRMPFQACEARVPETTKGSCRECCTHMSAKVGRGVWAADTI